MRTQTWTLHAVRCDRCGFNSKPGPASTDVSAAAKKAGWDLYAGGDICPDCVRDVEAGTSLEGDRERLRIGIGDWDSADDRRGCIFLVVDVRGDLNANGDPAEAAVAIPGEGDTPMICWLKTEPLHVIHKASYQTVAVVP